MMADLTQVVVAGEDPDTLERTARAVCAQREAAVQLQIMLPPGLPSAVRQRAVALADELAQVVLTEAHERSEGAACNQALSSCQTPWISFLTCGDEVDERFAAYMLKAGTDQQAEVVVGRSYLRGRTGHVASDTDAATLLSRHGSRLFILMHAGSLLFSTAFVRQQKLGFPREVVLRGEQLFLHQVALRVSQVVVELRAAHIHPLPAVRAFFDHAQVQSIIYMAQVISRNLERNAWQLLDRPEERLGLAWVYTALLSELRAMADHGGEALDRLTAALLGRELLRRCPAQTELQLLLHGPAEKQPVQ